MNERNKALKPCPFCGGDAEMDPQMGFITFDSQKRVSTRCVIYCTKCNADMGICYEDVPDMTHDHAMQAVRDMWNTRALSDQAPQDSGLLSEADIIEKIKKECGNASQKAVAARIQCSRQHICDILHGRRKVTERIAKGYGFRKVIRFSKHMEASDDES